MGEFRARPTRRLAGLGLAASAALALAGVAATPAMAAGTVLGTGSATAVEDSYIVVYQDSPGIDAAELTEDLAVEHDVAVRFRYSAAVRGFAGTMSAKAAAAIAADPAVAFVEQNQHLSLSATQTPTPSWGLDRIDQRNLPLDNSYSYDTTGSGVTAYIIDTGVRTSHTDFAGRASWGVNTTGDGNDSDCHGHGTHVAGTVGGSSFGVAKGVRLIAVKVLNCAGSGTTAGVVAGVDWASGHHTGGPAVANMSLGGGVQTALDTAVRNSVADGISYAIAAGNSASDACNFSPARVAEAITVLATDSNDARSSFSNYGTCTDIFAPGRNITSAWNTSDTATNTISGTSMATPHVAGAAARYLQTNPGANPAQVSAALAGAATPNVVTNPGAGSPNRLLYTGSATPQPGQDRLLRGQSLSSGESLRSPDGRFRLVMQGDGNLVEYDQAGTPLWHTGTHGSGANVAVLQGDGNFVLYRSDGVPVWHTGTYGTAADTLVVQNDANVVLYGPGGQVFWHR